MNIIEIADRLFGWSAAGPAVRAAIIVGLCASVESLFIYVSNRRERIIAMKIVSDVLWAVHYALFGSATASLLNCLAIGRETVFYNRGRKKWADSRIWMWVFIAAMLSSPVLESVTSGFRLLLLLPAVGSALAVVGFYCKNTVATKLLLFASTLLYLIYNTAEGNAMGVIGTIGPIVSTLAGLIHEIAARRAAKTNGNQNAQ